MIKLDRTIHISKPYFGSRVVERMSGGVHYKAGAIHL